MTPSRRRLRVGLQSPAACYDAAVQLTLIRHAESTYNVAGRWQGQGDAPLSELGLEQAAALGRRMAKRARAFDRVIASDLSRAAQTARAIGDERVQLDPIWREIDVGAWEGLTREEVAERFPDQVEAVARGGEVKIGGAESYAELGDRAVRAFERLVASCGPDEHVAVVSHGGLISALLGRVFGTGNRVPKPLARLMNTGVTVLDLPDAATRRVIRFNDATHLGVHSAYAEERRARGVAVLALIAHEAAEHTRVERLTAWYDAIDELYVDSDDATRTTAAALAQARGLEPRPLPTGSLAEVAWTIADTHRARRVAIVASPRAIEATAAALIGTTAPLASCGPTHVAHLVLGLKGRMLADWNLAPHLD